MRQAVRILLRAGPSVSEDLPVSTRSSATACTAAGLSYTNSGASTTLIESWDGTSWSVVPSPNPAPESGLSGASCISATACTAVGLSGSGTVIESWDGTSWSVVPSPGTGIFGLDGVSCVSADRMHGRGQRPQPRRLQDPDRVRDSRRVTRDTPSRQRHGSRPLPGPVMPGSPGAGTAGQDDQGMTAASPASNWRWAACSSLITCMTALMRARWVKACGKLPRCLPDRGSISSAYSNSGLA